MIVRWPSPGFIRFLGFSTIFLFLCYTLQRHSLDARSLDKSRIKSVKRPSPVVQKSPLDLLPGFHHKILDILRRPLSLSQKVLSSTSSQGCINFPNTKDILVVMRTGTTEAHKKLPIHLLTALKCLDDSIIFSDMSIQIGDYQIIDALEDIKDQATLQNTDFALYSELKRYARLRLDPQDFEDPEKSWRLDKFKFVPILKKAWEHRQDAKWYVFIEADTFVNWHNMRRLLDRFDSTEMLYIGSPALDGIEVAQSGSGYIISGAAMKKAVGAKGQLLDKYSRQVNKVTFGDKMPATVLRDEGIGVTRVWPMFNGQTPTSTAFGERQWCQPAIAMHNMAPFQISIVWSFEQEWIAKRKDRPILWMDIYDRFVHNNIQEQRENWATLSMDFALNDDLQYIPHWEDHSTTRIRSRSPSACRRLCRCHDYCLSWEHHNMTCYLGRTFLHGESKPSDGRSRWVSGWHLERIARFRKSMDDCSQGPDWSYTKADLSAW